MAKGKFKPIVESNCESETGRPLQYFVNLTGIQGIHNDFKFEDGIDHQAYISQGALTIIFETDLLSVLTRTIDLKGNYIFNQEIGSTGKQKGIALDVLQAQVQEAVKCDFKTIQAVAYRDQKKSNQYDGYGIWGRYGFKMVKDSHRDFLKKTRAHGRNETTLYNLQIHKQGNDFWTKEGFLWCGDFDLSANSDSHAILNSAIERRLSISKAKNYNS